MKCWTVLALLFAICAVFLSFGHTEETEDDFKQPDFEYEVNEDEM